MNILSISRHPSCKLTDQLCLSSRRTDLRLWSAFQEPLAKKKSTLCVRENSYMTILHRESTAYVKDGITGKHHFTLILVMLDNTKDQIVLT